MINFQLEIIMTNSTFILKHALMYFVAFLLCFGPIAGYIYALKKYEPFIMFDQRMPAVEVQKANNDTDWNLNIRPTARGEQTSMSETKQLVQKYESLLRKHDGLQETIRVFSTSSISKDGRIEISRKTLNDLFVTQKEMPTAFMDGWNSSTSTEWISYSNPDLGITSMLIPYNPLWGNRMVKIVPYEVFTPESGHIIETRIDFGKVGVVNRDEGWNSWPGDYSLMIASRREADKVKQDLLSAEHMHKGEVTIKRINGHDVVSARRWIDYAGMYPMVYEIVGSRYNYLLRYDIRSQYDEVQMRRIVESIVVE